MHPPGIFVGAAALAAVLFTARLAAEESKKDHVPALDAPASQPVSNGSHTLTAPDLEAFLDGFMRLQLGREDIAGAVIAVVKDGSVFFAKGYGFADVEKKVPVTPDGTLFRPGSISKLFTWTAVMQLVEQGKLDLDRDVNDYLDFKIPVAFAKPITLRNLMTHTGGFEETVRDVIVPLPTDLQPLREYLQTNLPARIFPPGTVPAYSNYGCTLAGYIVERVSGERFEDYIAKHIFEPLKMDRTTMMEPLPEKLQPLMSCGYVRASQGAKPYEVLQTIPAGSCATTAMDMTHFMLANLRGGAWEGGRILRPETLQLMHTRQFAYDPELNGMTLGFMDRTQYNHRVIGHDGDTIYFHSDMHLVPDLDLGFFVSYNSAGTGELSPRTELWRAFLERYYPFSPPEKAPVATARQDARAVAGSYLMSRREETTVMYAADRFATMEVTANGDGTITVPGSHKLNGQPKRFQEIGPLLYREVDGHTRIAFQRDTNGRLILVTEWPEFICQRVPMTGTKGFLMCVLGLSVGAILLTLLLWPVAALVRRHYGVKLDLTAAQRRWRLAVFVVCAIQAVLPLFFAVLAATGALTDINAVHTLGSVLWLVASLSLLSVIGTPIQIVRAFRVLQERAWWGTKIQCVAVALAGIGLSWFLVTSNLLSFSTRY